MYEVCSGGKLYVCHIDQLIQISSKFKDVDEDDDWYFNIVNSNHNNSNNWRYPERIRCPVVRYGVDERH